MDEADSERRLGVEAFAGQEEAPCCRCADSWKDERRDHGRDDPELDFGKAENRSRRRDGDVGTADKPRAAAERVALDPRDDRGRAGVDRREHPVEAERVLDVFVVGEIDRRALPVDVGAGAEALAVTRQHDCSRVADVGEGLGQLADQFRIERVAAFGARQRDPQQRAVTLDPQRAHSQELRLVRC